MKKLITLLFVLTCFAATSQVDTIPEWGSSIVFDNFIYGNPAAISDSIKFRKYEITYEDIRDYANWCKNEGSEIKYEIRVVSAQSRSPKDETFLLSDRQSEKKNDMMVYVRKTKVRKTPTFEGFKEWLELNGKN